MEVGRRYCYLDTLIFLQSIAPPNHVVVYDHDNMENTLYHISTLKHLGRQTGTEMDGKVVCIDDYLFVCHFFHLSMFVHPQLPPPVSEEVYYSSDPPTFVQPQLPVPQ